MPRFLRLQEGWLTVGLLALLLFSVTLSIQQAQWSDGLTILTPITIVALVTGIVLAKIRGVPRILLDLVGLNAGIVTVLVAVSSIMTDSRLVTIQDKVQDLIVRTGAWVGAFARQDSSDDLLVFILSLAIVAWVLAYSSAYFVFRSRQLWWALVPNGVALLINLSYSLVPLNNYIIVFMFSALLLMIRFNLLLQEERWQRERVNYSPALTWGFLWAGSFVSILLAVAMWFVPTAAVNSTLSGVWDKVNQPWVDFQNRMSALWSQVPGNQSIGGYSSFNDRFTMGGALNLSQSVAMEVQTPEENRLYWRAKTYDQYNGIGWRNTAPETLHVLPNSSSRLALEANTQLVSEDLARRPVTYTVRLLHPKDDLVFAVSRPVQLSIASRLDVSWRTINEVFSVDRYNQAAASRVAVPLELRTLLGMLGQAQRELREKGCDASLDPNQCPFATSMGDLLRQQIDTLDRRGLKVTFDVAPGTNYQMDLRASGEVPVYDDLTSVNSVGPTPPNQAYAATSMVTEATGDELRNAGIDYEQWVIDRYLILPATVPQRVRDKAHEVVREAGATNPYDAAKAIETWLRQNFRYSITIANPPSGVDRVDWFLFQGKEGYCEYYASAMTVMLRSVGVPVRMASGYATGAYDPDKRAYVVREADAHTWPEVYFPRYGWVEFEPTPSQAVVTHDGTVAGATPVPSTTPGPGPVTTPPRRDPDKDFNPTIPNTTGGGIGPGGAAVPLGLLGLLAVLLAIATWIVPVAPWARRERRTPAADFYYGRMLGWARVLGLGPATHQTPYEFGEGVARALPGSTLFTRTITKAYVRERFSGVPLPVDERISARRAWDALRRRFIRSLPSLEFRRASRRRR